MLIVCESLPLIWSGHRKEFEKLSISCCFILETGCYRWGEQYLLLDKFRSFPSDDFNSLGALLDLLWNLGMKLVKILLPGVELLGPMGTIILKR